MYADLEAGTVAYIGNGGTNNSMLAVDIKKGPTPVTVTTKLTLVTLLLLFQQTLLLLLVARL